MVFYAYGCGSGDIWSLDDRNYNGHGEFHEA